MGKWMAGIIAGVLVGSVMWLLSNRFFPEWFGKPPQPPAKLLEVECQASPSTVAPGATTEVSVKVLFGGKPVEGASVSLSVGGGRFASGRTDTKGLTYSGGVFRTTWTAPSPSARGYNVPAIASIEGLRTEDGELHGSRRTDCMILVRE